MLKIATLLAVLIMSQISFAQDEHKEIPFADPSPWDLLLKVKDEHPDLYLKCLDQGRTTWSGKNFTGDFACYGEDGLFKVTVGYKYQVLPDKSPTFKWDGVLKFNKVKFEPETADGFDRAIENMLQGS